MLSRMRCPLAAPHTHLQTATRVLRTRRIAISINHLAAGRFPEGIGTASHDETRMQGG